MRGIAVLLPVKYKLKQLYTVAGSWGTLASSTPKKQESNDSGEGVRVLNKKADPIVAFSRPPPLPPFLGMLVTLSLFETWSSSEDEDD